MQWSPLPRMQPRQCFPLQRLYWRLRSSVITPSSIETLPLKARCARALASSWRISATTRHGLWPALWLQWYPLCTSSKKTGFRACSAGSPTCWTTGFHCLKVRAPPEYMSPCALGIVSSSCSGPCPQTIACQHTPPTLDNTALPSALQPLQCPQTCFQQSCFGLWCSGSAGPWARSSLPNGLNRIHHEKHHRVWYPWVIGLQHCQGRAGSRACTPRLSRRSSAARTRPALQPSTESVPFGG